MPGQALVCMRSVIRWSIGAVTVALVLTAINTPFWKNAGNIFVARLSMSKSLEQRTRLEWKAFTESLYGRVVSPAPEQSDVWLWLAEANAAAGDWEGAADRYRRFVLQGGDKQRAFKRLGALASYQVWCKSDGQPLLAVAQKISGAAEAYRVWGDACVAAGDLDLAIEAYRHMLQSDPSYTHVALLASTLMRSAENAKSSLPDRATANYAEIVQILEQYPPEGQAAAHGYYLQAWSYLQLNQIEKAFAAYSRCVGSNHTLDRDAFVCALHLGYAYSQWLPPNDRDLNKALAYYQQAEKIAPYDVNLFEVKLAEGQTWLQLGNPEKALMLFQAAVTLQPTCLECGLSLGDTLVALGRVTEGRNQYRDVLRYFPEDQRAVTALERLEGQP